MMAVALLMMVGRFFNKRNLPSSPADAALVFGTGMDWKARSRWDTAAELYHRGLVRRLIVSGGVGVRETGLTEAEWFRDNLIRLGVLSEHIHLENRATNTAENTDYALPILKANGFKSVILVMSDFEGIRAYLTAKRSWLGEDIEIYNCHAPSPGRWSTGGWWLSRHGWKLTFHTLPRLYRYGLLRYL